MKHRYLLPVALLAAAVFATTSWAVTSKDTFDLKGEVYASGFKIEMTTRAGAALKRIKAGTYRIKIEDKATIHNFHLVGPGVNKATSVPKLGTTTWTVTLKKGAYTYVCDPHASMMKGSFTVT
jgi:plastocyanin